MRPDDLAAAIEAGEIAGAGLDVFEQEPLPAAHPLWAMPGVLLTPHTAGVRALSRQAALRHHPRQLPAFSAASRCATSSTRPAGSDPRGIEAGPDDCKGPDPGLRRKRRARWISAVGPSRQPLRGFLRMRNFLNAIKGLPHAQGAHWARLEARTAGMQPISSQPSYAGKAIQFGPLYSGSPRTSRGKSPAIPRASRINSRFSGGRRWTAARPTSRASRTGGNEFENSRLSPRLRPPG